VNKTHCQGHQDPSKRVPIFLGGTEANLKMVPIGPVPISRSRTVHNTGRSKAGKLRAEVLRRSYNELNGESDEGGPA